MASSTKTVCVIGAGPSGLVAAKTLVHDHPKDTFHVTVFEKSDRIGGLWPITKEDDGMVNPDMSTNQSRHTVSFSDLAWPATTPAFPKAWQVGEYLQRYIKTYPGYDIRTGCKVIKSEYRNQKWRVHIEMKKAPGDLEVSHFDHVIVTSGFFGKPKIPQILDGFQAPVTHSSKFRNLESLTRNNGEESVLAGKTIVVVGGQMSGVEVAASLALQISSKANAPGASDNSSRNQLNITHIIQRPFWVMPWFFPTKPQTSDKKPNPAPSFLPLDLVMWNLETRPLGPLTNTSGRITKEATVFTHDIMESFLGGNQSEFGFPELAITDDVRSEPPFLGISEEYTEFVRSENIKVVKGKVTGYSKNSKDTIKIEDQGQEQHINDVCAVIFATGFEATPSLDFLPGDILETLQFDPTGDEFALALDMHSTISRKIPSLGFVGFYRSPFWGNMEMQARFLGKLWNGDVKAAKALAEDESMSIMLKLRKDPRRGQYPMGDYPYLMEVFSDAVGIKRLEPGRDHSARTGRVFGPRYTYENASEVQKKETSLALKNFNDNFEESARGKYLARAVFRALQGDWRLDREIKSFIDSYPSGKLTGTAQFLPRYPTADGFDKEYLYLEKGDFTSTAGHKFTAKRSYVYRYAEATDKLTVWFTKDDHRTVDYFFHEIEFSAQPGPQGWKAKANHWCSPDQYDVDYDFSFKGVNLEKWCPKYKVKGPNKDYTLESHFSR